MIEKEDINKNLLLQLGLSEEDYNEITITLNKNPTITELAIYSAMWSEHCSYKSSKYWLKKLPTKAPWVIQGPGENAGVIDIGLGNAIVFKIESHNHPSFIEPYQGAATGVGGIMRDIFTMGAKPIANLNCLRFGSIKDSKTKQLFKGVVSGVGDYGNCTGVPTVGGECSFDERYNKNILVNAMTVGIAKKDKIFYAKAGKPGNIVVYVGSKTGKDGINGASMSSGSFNTDTDSLKPTVQVGDPFTEKLLMEACLELMKKDAIIGIQDMGAAGLTSSSVELAALSNLGIDINLNKIPLRDKSMTPDQIMLSESQERMLIILNPKKEALAKKIFKKWDLDFSNIGKITKEEKILLRFNNEIVANIPIFSLVSSKVYKRTYTKNIKSYEKKLYPSLKVSEVIKKIISSPNKGNKKHIWEQYDHMITRNILSTMGGNASVIKTNNKYQAIAVTTDCNIFYCDSDPYKGSIQAVSESYRNLISVGAKPLALTNCLNYGNPEKKEIMGQFVKSIKGLSLASSKLRVPVVSGNVSFYNETNDNSIPPTPQIGAVGVINDFRKIISNKSQKVDDALYLIGSTNGHLSCSAYERCFYNFSNIKYSTMPPQVDLLEEVKNAKCISTLINDQLITACHDISDGGLLIAIIEMCMAGNTSFKFDNISKKHSFLFGEDQSRYIITVKEINIKKIEHLLNKKEIHYQRIGRIKNYNTLLNFPDKSTISMEEVEKINNTWINKVS